MKSDIEKIEEWLKDSMFLTRVLQEVCYLDKVIGEGLKYEIKGDAFEQALLYLETLKGSNNDGIPDNPVAD